MYRKFSNNEIEKIRHGGFKSFIKRAVKSGVSVDIFIEDESLLRLSYKGEVFYCRIGAVPVFKRLGNYTKNKQLTKLILKDVGIRTPLGILSKSFKNALKLISENKLKFPLIVKPLDGTVARGVTWNINNNDELKKAVEFFDETRNNYKLDPHFMVEEMILGDEFRILVFKNKVVSCVKKIPAGVIGDGKLSIEELVKKFNKTRRKGFEIKLDKVAKNTMKKNNVKLGTILPKGSFFKFRNNLNMSDGGRSIDVTHTMHHSFKRICEIAVEVTGLTYGGVDLITCNISEKNDTYAILEINPNPYYNMNEKPLVEGIGIDFSKMVLEDIFPRLKK